MPVLHIIHIMFRDSQNPGSIQKFLSLLVFLEEFHPYFLLVPVQNNFRLELSLRWYYTPKRQQLLKRLINYLLSNCFFSLYFTCALFLLYFVQLDIRAQLLKGTLDKQCNTTKLLTWICPFCIIHTVFRDFRNPGSNQKFLSLVVFLEGFYPYFRLVPVQNNFRLQLSLKRN